MPSPADLGLPPKFREWRKGQEKAFEQIHYGSGRFVILNTSTGGGKSATSMASALLDAEGDEPRRTLYLTATRQLQNQLLCIAPSTRVLTLDLRWVKASTVEVGDELVGFDESPRPNRRMWRRAVVEDVRVLRRPCLRLTLEDGTVVVCSREHRWLIPHPARWVRTDRLRIMSNGASRLAKVADVWQEVDSYDMGYLAATFDGEGHLHQRPPARGQGYDVNLSFAQVQNEMLDQARALLHKYGFKYNINWTERINPKHQRCARVTLSGRRTTMRFLGQVRPSRLLPKLDPDRLGMMNPVQGVKIISIEDVGEQEVVAIKTSTRTYVAEGFASHNCDFESVGLTDIRGRDNYTCNIDTQHTAASAKCTYGVWCPRTKVDKRTGRRNEGPCDYYDQKRDAADAAMTLSNYAFWLHDEESGALGRYHRIILDEAHRAIEQIEKFAAVEITDREILDYGGKIPIKGQGQGSWKIAMLDTVQKATTERKQKSGESRGDYLRWMKRGKDLERRLSRLCRLSAQEWLCSRVGKTWKWELLNAGALAEHLLFRGASKVVLVSATVNRKTLELLGVRDPNIRLVEQDSTFPVANRPIYYWPVVRVGQGMDNVDRKRWAEAIDAVIGERLDRNGLMHSVSYSRAKELAAQSKYCGSGYFLIHENTGPNAMSLAEILKVFIERGKRRPTMLITPSAMEGVDLPGTICEYQIIPKMPFPDLRDPLLKAKKSRDKDYLPYIVLQNVVQAAGRVVRSRDDKGETFILDSHWQWLKGGYYQYLPRWFQVALRTLPQRQPPPAPLPKLTS